MNVEQLHHCFFGSLQADPNVRRQAEAQLNELSHQVGFLAACLDILSTPDVQPIVKQSCSIYFKNVILKNWTVGTLIDNDERPIIRERLLVSIVKLDKILRNQLLPALSLIIKFDYPSTWPNLLDHILNLINNSNSDINSLYIGIYSFTELCRIYRWKHNSDRQAVLDPIISNFFPSLISLGTHLLEDTTSRGSYEASEILKLIIKCYKFVTYLDFPEQLRNGQPLIDWITFHVKVITADFSGNAPEGWFKAQKWAYHNLYRLFQRYGTKTLTSKFQYDEFRANFKANVLPQLINVYMGNLEKWTSGNKIISDASLYHLIQLFEQALLKKDTFKLVEPHFNFIIVTLSFRIFNPKDEELELFEDEPEEYIHRIFEIVEGNTGEDSLHSFLFTLVEKRADYLVPMFQFIGEKFTELAQHDTVEAARAKEALMKFISPISYKLSQPNNPIFNEVEPFLNNFIIPNFQSNHQFLKARVNNLVSKFDNLEIRDVKTVENLFNGIMSSFLDESSQLPVQIQAALAIQAFIINDAFKNSLDNYVLKLMERLMELSNKFDSDILPAVMQELVESFPDKLEPFADQLMEQLCIKLTSLLKSIGEMSNSLEDYDDFDNMANDKTSTALGILNTMITILLYFENSVDIISKLEVYYSQVIKLIFEDKIEDFYAEAGELIENTLFLTRKVSPLMWSLLPQFVQCLLNDEDITLYLEDSLPALKNYLIFGASTIQENVHVQELYYRIILNVFEMDFDEGDVGFSDLVHISDLATTFVLSLNSSIAGKYVPSLINYSSKFLIDINDTLKEKGKPFRIAVLDNIIASLVIDPNSTLKSLIESNQIENFMANWFNSTDDLKRVFDIKLSILGYISLLSIDLQSIDSMGLSRALNTCGMNLTKLFIIIPQAIKDLEKKRSEYADKSWENELTYNINQVNDDDDDVTANAGQTPLGGVDGEDDEEQDYSNFFTGENKFSFESDEELQEDPYSNTSLDNINIFSQFKSFILGVQNNEGDKYGHIFGQLTDSDKEMLTSILNSI